MLSKMAGLTNLMIVMLFVFIYQTKGQTYKTRRLLRVHRLEMCNKSENAAMEIREVHVVNPEGENTLFSFTAVMKRELRENPRIVAEVFRCASKEALDTCEHFTTLKPLSSCQLLIMPHSPWESMVNKVKPPFTCPFKKGRYVLTDATANPELFPVFSLDNYFWKVKVTVWEGTSEDFIIFCFDFNIVKAKIKQ